MNKRLLEYKVWREKREKIDPKIKYIVGWSFYGNKPAEIEHSETIDEVFDLITGETTKIAPVEVKYTSKRYNLFQNGDSCQP